MARTAVPGRTVAFPAAGASPTPISEDRCAIARLHQQGCSIRQIAAALDRSPSSISRELKRNSGTQLGYKPAYADQKAKARRWTGSKLERDHELREIALQGLARRWSPEQVAGWLRRSKPPRRISYETIYRFIYAQIRRTNDGAWRLYLPRQKYKRGRRPRPGGSPAKLIKDRVPISLRPKAADARRQTGHWEADLMLFSKIWPGHPRRSRAKVPHPSPRQATVQASQTNHPPAPGLAQAVRQPTGQNPYLR